MSQIWLGGKGKNEYIVWANSQDEISDGYHTFAELYEHRHTLACLLFLQYKDIAFKTRKDEKNEEWEGWFIAGLNIEGVGQVSYHFPIKYWDMLPVKEILYNSNYDNHTSIDVLVRLGNLLVQLAENTKHALCSCNCDSDSVCQSANLAQDNESATDTDRHTD